MNRLKSMERRFVSNPNFYKLYRDFMTEYGDLGHMKEVPADQIRLCKFFLPHHGVMKESSTTSKLRVVFDGSAKSSNGKSLNDVLLVGPTLQSSLYSILIKFRKHRYVFTADIEKMYRQILDMYVDDLMTGGDTIENVLKLKVDIDQILSSSGFKLRKWVSNSCDVVPTPVNDPLKEILEFESDSVKVLGLNWNSADDSFNFKVELDSEFTPTKRKLLSEFSRIFDPLGWLSPITISIKIMFLKIMALKIRLG